jgi:hypothetical protein
MIENEDRSSHWQVLAEQLGLEPEKPAAPRPPAPEKAVAPAARLGPAVERSVSMKAPTPEPNDAEEENARRDWKGAPENVAETPPIAEQPAQRERPGSDQGEGEGEAEGERGSKQRSGRRRRRRSRSADSSAPNETVTGPADDSAVNEPKAKSAEKDSDDSPRERSGRGGRGRRRGGDRAASPRVETPVTNAQDEEPVVDAAEDADLDDLSNWQAPSWQELIGSLYRPDR